MKRNTIGLLAILCLLIASSAGASGLNLVTNHDFSAGAVAFTSDYTNVDGTVADSCWDPGTFAVSGSADPCHRLWTTGGDHSTGTGLFMLVNGKTDAAATIWEQEIGVETDTDYTFSAWLKNLCCQSVYGVASALEFYVNDALIGSGNVGEPDVWNWSQQSSIWNSAENTIARVKIVNTTLNFDGNDFGLDDIFFGKDNPIDSGATPEPASMLLLGSGLIGLGTAVRRRAKRGEIETR